MARSVGLLGLFALACATPDDSAPVDSDEPVDTGDTAEPCTPTTWYLDLDGDGHGGSVQTVGCVAPVGWAAATGDCDDGRADAFPGAPEHCNTADDDCDGEVDEDPVDPLRVFVDDDGDGFGDTPSEHQACSLAEGRALQGGDCDDHDAGVRPDAVEVCDGRDQDCDGVADDEALDAGTFYADADGDGHGDAAAPVQACVPPAGATADATDCDDTDPAIHPFAPTTCGAVDHDCDGLLSDDDPDSTGWTSWFADADGDGYGQESVAVSACDAPAGFSAVAGDCDDADTGFNPAATEVCAAGDEDCDGVEGDSDPSVADPTPWYVDADGDGYGYTSAGSRCDQPGGTTDNALDCNDANAAISPVGVELCGGGDEDCDGLLDDADPDVADASTWYPDADGDLYGDSAGVFTACDGSGATFDAGDCDDTDASLHPFALDSCEDGVDQDCYGGDQACSLTGDWGLEAADAYMIGGGGSAGDMVSGAGDVNGDGYDDVLVGAPNADAAGAKSGMAYLVYGNTSGTLTLDTDAVTLLGAVEGETAGSGLSGVGDVDGDGYGDFLVGAYLGGTDFSGQVYLMSGASMPAAGNTLSLGTAMATFPGTGPYDYAGNFAANAGDVNADGTDDFLITATGDSTDGYHAGATYLVLGQTFSGEQDLDNGQATFLGDGSGSHSGGMADSAGDFNGDGLDDVLIGAEADNTVDVLAGAAYVLISPQSGVVSLGAADLQAYGEAGADLAGCSVAGVGDTDGDGYDDVMVGAEANNRGGFEAGTAYILRGPGAGIKSLSTADAFLVGAEPGQQSSHSLAGPGDVDGDGYADMAVGVWHDSTLGHFFGSVALVYGPASGTVDLGAADARLWGQGSAGAAVAEAGDTDGDGLMDLIIGGPTYNTSGAAFLVLGRTR